MPGRMPYSKAAVEAFYSFLDDNRSMLQYAHKGYLRQLQQMFSEQQGVQYNVHWIRKYLALYRTTHNCPVSYVDNKYYCSERKGNVEKPMATLARALYEVYETNFFDDVIDRGNLYEDLFDGDERPLLEFGKRFASYIYSRCGAKVKPEELLAVYNEKNDSH